jgi:hypothetical protein
MANILIFNHSEIIEKNQRRNICYTEGLIKSFLIRGHNVKNIITSNYLMDAWCGLNILKSNINYKYLLKKIKDFNPDLIISFNNSKLPNIEKELDCPIVIWEADKFYFFSDKYNLKKNSSRYFFFSSTLNGHSQFIKYFGAKKEKIFFMPHSTSVQCKIVKQDKNITFLGALYDLRIDKSNDFTLEKSNALYRKNILSSIKDFGLKIFTNVVPIFYKDLHHLCDKKKFHYSISHNEKIFNSSKISLNVSHLQAKNNTVSYRAIDIMASNSLLITEHSKYLMFFLKKLSKIFYNTPFDLRKKVKYFLENPNARKDMINIQNEITKKNFLWIDRVKEIEQIFGLKKNTINTISTNLYSKVFNESNKLYQSAVISNNLSTIVFSSIFIVDGTKIKDISVDETLVNKFITKLKFFLLKKNTELRLSIKKINIFVYYFYFFICYIKYRRSEVKKKSSNL